MQHDLVPSEGAKNELPTARLPGRGIGESQRKLAGSQRRNVLTVPLISAGSVERAGSKVRKWTCLGKGESVPRTDSLTTK